MRQTKYYAGVKFCILCLVTLLNYLFFWLGTIFKNYLEVVIIISDKCICLLLTSVTPWKTVVVVLVYAVCTRNFNTGRYICMRISKSMKDSKCIKFESCAILYKFLSFNSFEFVHYFWSHYLLFVIIIESGFLIWKYHFFCN